MRAQSVVYSLEQIVEWFSPERLFPRGGPVSQPVLLLFVGFVYTIFFGGFSYLRREGLSVRFAVEAIVLTLAAAALAFANLFPFHPALFLLLLYVATLRVRILVDLGNFFGMRRQFARAQALYTLAERAWPDLASSLIIRINRGTLRLQQGETDEAIRILKDVLDQGAQGNLGVKYEAATHFNLGVAYRRKGAEAQATREFNAAIDTWPASEYARRAVSALEQGRSKK